MENKKIAVMIYPFFSMQEISCLTAALTIWYEQKIDIYGSTKELIRSEDGFGVIPDKTFEEFLPENYSCLVMPGILNPLPALFDEKNIAFLKGLKGRDILISAISSSPLLLAKAGLLEGIKFTSGAWEEMIRGLDFIPKENYCHQPLIHDGNFITASGFAFRELAAETIRTLGLDACEGRFFSPVDKTYTEEELTFFMGDDEFAELMAEYKEYEEKGTQKE